MAEQIDAGAPIRALYAAINQQDAESFKQFMDEKIELTDLSLGKQVNGIEEVKRYFKNWWTAFPQGTGEIKNTLVSGEQVVVESTGRGKQTGPFELEQGRLEGSNQDLGFNFVHICRVQNGKIVSIRSYSDAYRVLIAAAKTQEVAA